jgi:hypothetical protein
VKFLREVVTLFRRDTVRSEEIRKGKGWQVWWKKYIFTRLGGERMWTKRRITGCLRKCWTVDLQAVVC